MPMPDRYAVFGNPISHSKSPRIHALFAAQTGEDMSYEARQAPVDGFAAAVRQFADSGGKGANVTVPFKEEAFRLADALTPRAQAAGAVNTLSFEGETIRGDNTDGVGLVRDLVHNQGFDIAGKRILLLGAGGAARGVILPILEERPTTLVIANRTEEKAFRLAIGFAGKADLLPEACGFAQLAGREFDLVINATSSGLSDAPLPLPPGLFAPRSLAYEMVYGRETPFMRQARAEGGPGIRVADGMGMLVEQAAEAFRLWRGQRPATGPVLLAMLGNHQES